MISRLQPGDIRLLRIFVEVARRRNFSAAAEFLNVGQSSVSTQVKELEERLGFSLCVRGRGGFEVTAAGKRMFEAMQTLEQQMADFVARTAEITDELYGTLKIGIAALLSRNPAICGVPEVFREFTKRHPHVELTVEIIQQAAVEDLIENGSLDIAWSGTRITGRELEPVSLFEIDNHIYCGQSHLLFEAPNDFVRSELARQQSVIHQFDTDFQTPFAVATSTLTASSDASVLYILTGKFVGYLSDPLAAPFLDSGALRQLLPEQYNYTSPGGLIYRRSALSNPVIREFIAVATQERRLEEFGASAIRAATPSTG